MNLSSSVNKIFDQIGTLTGKEVRLIEKRDLDVYASVKIARKSMSSHLMYYKPEQTGILNHLIAHECGHILRIYGESPENRRIPYSNDEMRLKALKDIEPEIQRLSKTLPFQGLTQIANVWYTGTVKQLTNFPSDIQIEKWIYDEYPDLRPYQSRQIKREYDEAVQALSNRAEQLTPRKILNASNGMNYSFFNVMARHFNDAYYMRRYERSAYVGIGKKLMLLQDGAENSYNGDVDTVNKWAEALEISHWFGWRDFEDVPASYLKDFD